ncbi:helix-turn-helix domain-containing protein [Bacillus badius]|uniref:HTH cro/C1-type domain-containing protein n=1 Tax=Bacillus badius TaxID=1455 RepID=A0ABR5ATN9_BACBA|nr:helix-turn-helix transcriptional regulator [Bacillus badius]KIL78044.1 hypothetical protein SD77_1023 [Bacillus badius]MED4718609.1 helix-turn-helix transcriptional regulator [Bacillus badius]
MKVTDKIKAIRKAKDINQEVLADRLDITVQSYSLKERGKRPLMVTELEIIADALNVPVGIFFEKELNVKLNLTS